jgi:phosphotransferase system enzyme I (PtsI)
MNKIDNYQNGISRLQEASENETDQVIKGIAVSGGIAIGQVVVTARVTTEIYPQSILAPKDVDNEIKRFEAAVREAGDQLKKIKDGFDRGHPLNDHLYILDTHLMLLEDRMFFQGTKEAIASDKQNAEWALSEMVAKISGAFETIEDEYLRERARDIRFVAERVMGVLTGRASDKKIPPLPPNSVIVAHDLSPADTMQFPKDTVVGFAIDMGGRTSHTAIMARSLKIPAVSGLGKLSSIVHTGDTIIVDGATGVVILNPGPDVLVRYRDRQELHRNYTQSLMPFGRLPAVTSDGCRSIKIMANVEFPDEIGIAREHGCEGIGLFRTEYIFMGRSDLPSEEEQYEIYREVLTQMGSDPVTIRTLDIGGDKIAAQLNLSKETNPAMGLRAIRLCLSRRDIFKTQLRAILKAAVHGNCRLLIPMISCVQEVRATMEVLQEVKDELAGDGNEFDSDIEVGILVEVPSAVATADLLAKDVDFFSIGTNDLIQYSLAIDRLNEHVNYLYDTLHPAVLRLIRQVADVGEVSGIRVAMCGEMAGDPVNVPILVGLGLDELSMNALSIPLIKKLIRAVSVEECQDLTRKAFEMTSAEEIHGFLGEWLSKRFPDDHIETK